MRENQKLIDDVMALGGNLLGNILGARHEVRAQAEQRFESLAQRFNFVSRSEFDAAFAMLAKARAAQEELRERIGAIEAKLNLSSAAKGRKTAKARLPSVKKDNRRKKHA